MTESIAFQVHMDQPYEEAIEAVTAALKTEGFGVLTHIDVRVTLKKKLGQDFRPYAILGACNPSLAHRTLAHDAQAGLLLPCNITVGADAEGGSIVRAGNPAVLLLGVGEMGQDPVLREIAAEAWARLERVAKSLE